MHRLVLHYEFNDSISLSKNKHKKFLNTKKLFTKLFWYDIIHTVRTFLQNMKLNPKNITKLMKNVLIKYEIKSEKHY